MARTPNGAVRPSSILAQFAIAAAREMPLPSSAIDDRREMPLPSSAIDRLEAHIAYVRAASHHATPLASPTAQRSAVTFHDPPRPNGPASSFASPAAATAEDPLLKLEAFFASLRAGALANPSSAAAAPSPLVRPPPPEAAALSKYYDDIVQATVRRAWDRAWNAYQNGDAFGRRLDAVGEGASAAQPAVGLPPATGLPPAAAVPVSPQRASSSPWVGSVSRAPASGMSSPRLSVSTAGGASPAAMCGSSLPVRGHPHQPASNKRPPTSYSRQYAEMRRQR
jgi:hypothetical protein